MNSQNRFIKTIKHSLGRDENSTGDAALLFADKSSPEPQRCLERIASRTIAERRELLDRLIEASRTINLNVSINKDLASVSSAIVRLVAEKEPEWGNRKEVVAWRHPLAERLNLAAALEVLEVPVYFTDLNPKPADGEGNTSGCETVRNHVIDSYVGITSADFCMADTASLVLRTRIGQARSVSLLPSIHVAVIKESQIIADMKELFALIKYDPQTGPEGLTNCMTFVSGPSKTADIEAQMVFGAHGPRELYLYILMGS